LSRWDVHVEELEDPGIGDSMPIHLPLWLAGLAAKVEPFLPEWERQMDLLLVSWAKIGKELPAIDFVRAQVRRSELRDRLRRFFEHYDLLLLPTLPLTAFRAGIPVQEALSASPVDYRN
jgi:aspartyl-tRNA(Asn)/glutamyl-tRNA(Gln) amidotransferase subunit A